jgi:hypothetical protein
MPTRATGRCAKVEQERATEDVRGEGCYTRGPGDAPRAAPVGRANRCADVRTL